MCDAYSPESIQIYNVLELLCYVYNIQSRPRTCAGVPDHFTRVANLPTRRSLRSAGTNCLVVPASRPSTVGSRAFPVTGCRHAITYRKTWHRQNYWPHFLVSSRHTCSVRIPKNFDSLILKDSKHMAESDRLPSTMGALKQHAQRLHVKARVVRQASLIVHWPTTERIH